MLTSHDNGNLIIFDEKTKTWVYLDNRTTIHNNRRPCPKCGHLPTKEGHDYCIANLPGVLNACCGHGVKEGYIQFENGITIRGYFEVDEEYLTLERR